MKHKTVSVMLDKERNLLLDLNAMVEFENETGDSLFQLGSNLSPKHIRALLWACCLHEDDKADIKTIGSFVTIQNLNEYSDKLSEVMTIAYGESEEGQTEKN